MRFVTKAVRASAARRLLAGASFAALALGATPALAQDADLYLMDEPFAGVDAATERAIVTVLKELNAAGKTIVCVHHDLSTVPAYFDHVLLVNGRRIAAGPKCAGPIASC